MPKIAGFYKITIGDILTGMEAKKLLSRYSSMKSRAKKKNIPFDITLEDFLKILSARHCFYCKYHTANLAIDRTYPPLGYTKDNLVAACRNCNTIKNNILTFDEMVQLGKICKPQLGSRNP